MRLIDADKLKAQVKAHEIEYKFTPTDYQYGRNVGIYKAVTDIEGAAEVDAIPVSWIKAQMEKLRDSGFPFADFGAAGIFALLDTWEKEKNENS